MNIGQILPIDAIIPQLQARDKKQVLKRLAEHASNLCLLSENEILSALVEREHIGCTGMGNGVCIPHGRFNSLDTIHIVFARLDKAIDFGAADGKKVDLIFLLMTPSSANTEHLKALSVISKLLRDKELCKTLRATSDINELHALLTANYVTN
jgi:PTS system nitrogen regulatory IIA component